MSDTQPSSPQWEAVGRAADRHRWMWPVVSSTVGALLVGGSFVAGLLVRSFSAGWDARQVASEYVTQEQLGARLHVTDERLLEVERHAETLEHCCTSYTISSKWADWTTKCVLAMRERKPCPPIPVDIDRSDHAPFTPAVPATPAYPGRW